MEPLITVEQLESKIKNAINLMGNEVDSVQAKDVSGCGCGLKFEILIISR
jgi:hypothetical protein